jgi:hypothetical protein
VFRGPVHDFVDIYVWISRHTEHDLDLAELLAQPAGGRALHDLAGALRINDSSAPWIASAATSGALARLSYEPLREAGRPAIGLYRSSFTSSEGFGIGRHPAQEVHRSAVCSFSVLIDAVLAEQPDR